MTKKTAVKKKATTTKKKKKKAGAKDLYVELKINDKLEWITESIANGYTEKSIYESLGVSHNTFYKWKRERKRFIEAIDRGRGLQVKLVENQLLKKIMGYTVEETESLLDQHGNTLQRKVKTKFIQPDTTSMIFWLKNRDGENWKDRVEQHNTGDFEFNVTLDDEDE